MSKEKYSEPAAEVSFEEFRKVVESRRSIRVYKKDEPIPDQVVRECLDLALLAPNSSNLQAWEFYWVKDLEKKKSLVEACLSQPTAKTAPTLIVAVARTKTWMANSRRMLRALERQESETGVPVAKSARDYYSKLTLLAYSQGPLGLFGLIKRIGVFLTGFFRPVPREPNSFRQMEIWSVKTVSLACENLMLAFRAAGYDSCPMEGFDSVRVRKLLKLPRDASIVMVISAGKRAPGGIYGPRIRFDSTLFIKET